MTTLKLHRDGTVSRSGEIKFGRFYTSSPKEVEEETDNHMKIMKDISKIFHRTTNSEVIKMAFGSLRRNE